jgi:hypothetical protein
VQKELIWPSSMVETSEIERMQQTDGKLQLERSVLMLINEIPSFHETIRIYTKTWNLETSFMYTFLNDAIPQRTKKSTAPIIYCLPVQLSCDGLSRER